MAGTPWANAAALRGPPRSNGQQQQQQQQQQQYQQQDQGQQYQQQQEQDQSYEQQYYDQSQQFYQQQQQDDYQYDDIPDEGDQGQYYEDDDDENYDDAYYNPALAMTHNKDIGEATVSNYENVVMQLRLKGDIQPVSSFQHRMFDRSDMSSVSRPNMYEDDVVLPPPSTSYYD